VGKWGEWVEEWVSVGVNVGVGDMMLMVEKTWYKVSDRNPGALKSVPIPHTRQTTRMCNLRKVV